MPHITKTSTGYMTYTQLTETVIRKASGDPYAASVQDEIPVSSLRAGDLIVETVSDGSAYSAPRERFTVLTEADALLRRLGLHAP